MIKTKTLIHLAKAFHKLDQLDSYFREFDTPQPETELQELVAELRTFLSESFWDCECETHYIHSKDVRICPVCGAVEDDQPDSIISELLDESNIGND